MKILKIEKVGKRPVYDIHVNGSNSYLLENGVASHNSGPLLSANTVFFISKSKEKDGKELNGYNFNLIVHKSRYVRELARIPITVTYNEGILKYSGLFDIAKELEWIVMPASGWYQAINPHTGEVLVDKFRQKEKAHDDEFWKVLFREGLDEDIKDYYRLGSEKGVLEEQDTSSNIEEENLYDEED